MQPKSSWSRGLLYGGMCAGVVVVAVVALTMISGQEVESTLQASVLGASMWGGVGFLLGFFGHREPSADTSAHPVPTSRFSSVKRWIYRFIAGLLLGQLGAALVEVMMLRSSLMAAALGSLAGAWVGGSIGLLHPQYLESGHAPILATVAGSLAGIAAAIVLRLRVNRR